MSRMFLLPSREVWMDIHNLDVEKGLWKHLKASTAHRNDLSAIDPQPENKLRFHKKNYYTKLFRKMIANTSNYDDVTMQNDAQSHKIKYKVEKSRFMVYFLFFTTEYIRESNT